MQQKYSDKKIDRRIQRTRSMLRQALTELIIEKGYDRITVQDIIDRANVGRSTFYAHFYDKDQLLLSNINILRDNLRVQKNENESTASRKSFRFSFSLTMLLHVQKNQQMYRATVGRESGTTVVHHMKSMLLEITQEELGDFYTSLQIPQKIVSQIAVHTFLSLLIWWVDQKPHLSAEEIDQLFHKLTFSGIDALGVKKP